MQVLIAQPYDPYRLSSLGDAAYMLIRQEDFPLDYDEWRGDKKTCADHDRLLMWDYDHFRAACDKHMQTGECGICSWARKATKEAVFAFLKAALKADEAVEWTGFRITGTVNRWNGYPVYTLELFSKGKESNTKVYSGDFAPNVQTEESEERCIRGFNGEIYKVRDN